MILAGDYGAISSSAEPNAKIYLCAAAAFHDDDDGNENENNGAEEKSDALGVGEGGRQQQHYFCCPQQRGRVRTASTDSVLSSSASSFMVPVEGWTFEDVIEACESRGLGDEHHIDLMELGERLQDVSHPHNKASTVVRFLNTAGNVDQAEKMFRSTIEWRKRNRVDSILKEYRPPVEMIENIPGGILNEYDKEGDPIFVDRIVAADSVELYRRYGGSELIKHGIWMRETVTNGAWVEDYHRRQGKLPSRILLVVDLEGLSRYHLNRHVLSVFGEVMKLDQENYPDVVKKILLIRVPAIFRVIWSVIKHFFSSQQVDLMEFAGKNNYREVLGRYVGDLRKLPKEVVGDIGEGVVARGMPNRNFAGGRLPPISSSPDEDEKEAQ